MQKTSNMSEQQHERMLHTPIPKLILSLSAPSVASMLVTVVYNTADTWFVSQISTSASAAVGVVFAIMAIIQAVGYGLGMGAGSLISRKLGEKNNTEASKYAASAFVASFLFGLFVTIVGLSFLKPLLRLLGATETMLPYACDYAKYILISAPVMCASFALNNTLRAEGEAMLSMWGLCIGGILNMVLDPLLIFTAGFGIAGAGIATAVSQLVSFVILLCVMQFGKSIIRISWKNVSHDLSCYYLILSTGFPTICRQGMSSIASAVLNIQAAQYGDAAVAAVTIANKIYLLIRNIILGIGQGFQPVAGYNFGAKDMKRTRESFCFATIIGTVGCIIAAVLTSIFAAKLIGWFRDDAEVIRIGRVALLFACAVMPFMAYSTFVNQMYQCLGFKLPATFLASCRQGVCFLPIILIAPYFLGLLGVQMAQPLADLCTFFISVPFQIVFFRKHLPVSESA